jgi:starvation-inducible outer membrane lipoprotein
MTLNSVLFNRVGMARVSTAAVLFLVGCSAVPEAIANPVPLPQARDRSQFLQKNHLAKTKLHKLMLPISSS